EQQVRHFLETGMFGQVTHVITAIGQTGALLTHGGQGGLPGDLSAQSCASEYFCVSHCFLLLGFILDSAKLPCRLLVGSLARFNPSSARTTHRDSARRRDS